MTASPASWRSLPTMALDAFCVGFGVWWLVSVGLVYTHQTFATLQIAAIPAVALAIAACAVLVRPDPGPRAVATPREPAPDWLPAGLMPIGFALGAWYALGLPYAFAWAPMAMFALLVVWHTGPVSGPASVALTDRDAVSLGLAVLVAAVLVTGICRPEMDDAYHINAMISALEHPELPLLSFDGMHGDLTAPIQQVIHRPQTIEVFVATLASFTGADPRTLYWMGLPLVYAAMTAIATWRLMKALAPDTAWLGLWVVFVVWLAWGDEREYGAYVFPRLFLGKPVFICVFVPSILYGAARFSDRPSWRTYGVLALTVCAAGTFTSSALLLAPVVLGLGLLAQVRPGRAGWGLAAAGLTACAPLLVGLLAMRAEVSGVGGLRHDGWMREMATVLGSTSRAPVALFGMAALPVLAARLRSPTAAWAARMVAVSLLVVFNDVTAPILARTVAELFSWRLYWTVPVPLLASLALVLAVELGVRASRTTGVVTSVLAVVALVGFWTAGDRPLEGFGTEWHWWTHKVPELDQAAALGVVALTDPEDLVLAAPRVAERITGLDGRPRLVSVRESYLTNLSRYWGEEEAHERLVMMDYVAEPLAPRRAEEALTFISEWCPAVVVFRINNGKRRVAPRMRERGYVVVDTSKKYQTWRLAGDCVPVRPGPRPPAEDGASLAPAPGDG
ncbi:MAG: DUF6077 domain-containing protein [Myxococcota bacterium]